MSGASIAGRPGFEGGRVIAVQALAAHLRNIHAEVESISKALGNKISVFMSYISAGYSPHHHRHEEVKID